MAIPAHITAVTVTGTFLRLDGTPATGTVEFVLSAPASVPVDSTLIPQVTIVGTLVEGVLSVVLPATDDPDWSVTGLTYQVTERINGAIPREYHIAVPAASAGGALSLAAIAPAVAGPVLTSYVLLSAVGAPSGVASLDGTGNVPLAQLGNAPSGGGGGTPASTVVAATTYGQASTVGTATPYARGDHSHGTPALTSATASTSAVGDTAAVGTATTPARADHRHGRESYGTVVAQTAFGQTSGNGTAVTPSRSDHVHGTPTAPTATSVGADPTGTATGLVAAHVGGADPHGDRAYTDTGLATKAPTARQILAGSGLTGGGDLSADRTLSVSPNSTVQQVRVSAAGTLVGTRRELNLIQGAGVSLTVTDNAGADRVDVTVTATGGGGTLPTVRRAYITTGDVTLTANATWTAVIGLELALPAAVGDYVELFPSFMHNGAGSDYFDLAVLTGATPTIARRSSTGTASVTAADEGDPALYPSPGTFRTSGALFGLTVGAGDLDAGNVRFAVIVKGAGGSKVFASAAFPFRWRAINYGVVG